jgi:hypothetical protein
MLLRMRNYFFLRFSHFYGPASIYLNLINEIPELET